MTNIFENFEDLKNALLSRQTSVNTAYNRVCIVMEAMNYTLATNHESLPDTYTNAISREFRELNSSVALLIASMQDVNEVLSAFYAHAVDFMSMVSSLDDDNTDDDVSLEDVEHVAMEDATMLVGELLVQMGLRPKQREEDLITPFFE